MVDIFLCSMWMCLFCTTSMIYISILLFTNFVNLVNQLGNGLWKTFPRVLINNYSSIYDQDIDHSELSDYVKAQAAPIGSIEQVHHTNALFDGNYGLINEHGLALGESTCSGHLTSSSIKQGGKNYLSVRDLMNIARERCSTARCAILTMGSLAEKYGFYVHQSVSLQRLMCLVD